MRWRGSDGTDDEWFPARCVQNDYADLLAAFEAGADHHHRPVDDIGGNHDSEAAAAEGTEGTEGMASAGVPAGGGGSFSAFASSEAFASGGEGAFGDAPRYSWTAAASAPSREQTAQRQLPPKPLRMSLRQMRVPGWLRHEMRKATSLQSRARAEAQAAQ